MDIFDDLDDCFDTTPAVSSTPGPSPGVLGKRTRATTDSDTESNEPSSPDSPNVPPVARTVLTSNSLTFAKTLVAGKRLKQSQVEQIEQFAQVSLVKVRVASTNFSLRSAAS